FTVSHPRPHDNVSTELHRSGGPFTLVPLPNPTESAVVWMESSDKAAALMAQDDPEFAAAATERSCAVQGDLTVTSPRAVWPIISQRARSLTGERTVLIAEAAHVMPPIGAQGLNMSLADIRCLRDLAHANPNSLGDAAMLATYARRRHPDINLRMAGVDALNRAAIAGSDAWTALRMRGMQTLHGVTPLRRTAMRLGLGAGRLTG
ncbi:MAG: FAD-dependent monooxygenase, partial [Pseudomonadota bacterium]